MPIFDETTAAPRTPADCEIRDTLCELIGAFGAQSVFSCLSETPIAPFMGAGEETKLRTIAAVTLLILDSPKPSLTAQLLAKLSHLETVTRHEIRLEDLGRQHGLTKQAVSKQLSDLADRLGIRRPLSNEKARKSHYLMNRRNGQRKAHAA